MSKYYNLDNCCATGNFLGSSRTYVYQASSFDGLSKNIVTPATLKSEPRCLDLQSYAYGGWQRNYRVGKSGEAVDLSDVNNIILEQEQPKNNYECSHVEGFLGFQDRTEALYENIIVAKPMSHGHGHVIAWRDDGIINGILSPLYIAAWINCFGQPCFPCKIVANLKCQPGGPRPEDFLNKLGDLMDEYWSTEEKYVPWNGFILDWYGIIQRKAEPVTGWMIYLLFGGQNCAPCGYYDEYCSCCWFCILKDCIEPMFTARIYGGSVLTLNQRRGIPFLNKDNLQNFYDSLTNEYDYGNMDIKLNHIADEYVFFQGAASWYDGTISFTRAYKPSRKLPNSSEESNGEATIIDGSGTNVVILLNTDEKVPAISRTGDQGFLIRDTAIKYKSDLYITGDKEYGWLYVDIPAPISIEKSFVEFSADAGTLPDMAYGGGLGFNPWSPTWYDYMHKKLMIRSKEFDGGFRAFTSFFPPPSGPKPKFEKTLIYYYKRYIKKIVKTPYHLYLKSGETKFRECKLGETIKDLTPGRYYFPNPAYANRQLGVFDSDFEDLLEYDLVDKTENFKDYFNTVYRQFCVGKRKYSSSSEFKSERENTKKDMQKRYEIAVDLLGYPAANSSSIEYGGAFEYNQEDFDPQKLSDTLQQSIDATLAVESFFAIPR